MDIRTKYTTITLLPVVVIFGIYIAISGSIDTDSQTSSLKDTQQNIIPPAITLSSTKNQQTVPPPNTEPFQGEETVFEDKKTKNEGGKLIYEANDSKDNILSRDAYATLRDNLEAAIFFQFDRAQVTEPNFSLTKIGLEQNDIITAVNGTPISMIKEMREAIGSILAGPELVVELDRNNHYMKYTAIENNKE